MITKIRKSEGYYVACLAVLTASVVAMALMWLPEPQPPKPRVRGVTSGVLGAM